MDDGTFFILEAPELKSDVADAGIARARAHLRPEPSPDIILQSGMYVCSDGVCRVSQKCNLISFRGLIFACVILGPCLYTGPTKGGW